MQTVRSDHHSLILSPGCDVVFPGLRGSTRAMQAAGWEFAVEFDPCAFRYTVVMRHRDSGLTGIGNLDADAVNGAASRYTPMGRYTPRHGVDNPVIYVNRIMHDNARFVTYGEAVLPKFTRVDMNTSLAEMPMSQMSYTLHELGVFKPWAPDAQELVVDPNSVADLMSRIRTLQAPELQAIRERNRARDLREQRQENVVAQIITLAA